MPMRMLDIRPVGYVIGWLVGALGLAMLVPMVADLLAQDRHWTVFAVSALVTMTSGAGLVLACAAGRAPGLSVQQAFMLTSGSWVVFPIFGALPFVLGEPGASLTDAYFEAMSGLTTTGSTVFSGLQDLPAGTLFWRGLMQWIGGIGIIVVAMVFLPALKVGGMQFFRSEAFDTMGKILPRAAEIAASVTWLYIALTFFCFMGFVWTGQSGFDALVHAMTTIATGGFSNYDNSFEGMSAGSHYVGAVFMILAALPFVRYVQLVAGSARPILRDSQIHGFLAIIAAAVLVLVAWQTTRMPGVSGEEAFRLALYNVVSITTGAGFASTDYGAWGGFALVTFFVIGLIGGCSGSTTCSVKVFRYQILAAAIRARIQQLHTPHRIVPIRYQNRPVEAEVLHSVMAFFLLFFFTLAVVAVILVVIGLDPITAISGAATALANVGPGLGPEIGPTGNFAGLPDSAKWVLIATMLIGRLELISVFVLFTAAFWRR